jgi:hypothetical protein
MSPANSKRRVLRWDPHLDPDENAMEFRLTYAGELFGYRSDRRIQKSRSLHVHDIRKQFHRQLKKLWHEHPVLVSCLEYHDRRGFGPVQIFAHDGFQWIPMVTKHNGLICKLEILMLRPGQPGTTLADIDNRLKAIFDALKKAGGPDELGAKTPEGQQLPDEDEEPFFVLLEDDKLITHLAVTTDTLLEDVTGVESPDHAVRLVINVTVVPYNTSLSNADFV